MTTYNILGGLNNNNLSFFTVFEARSSRSSCWQNAGEASLFMAYRQYLLTVSSRGFYSVQAWREQLLVSLPLLMIPALSNQSPILMTPFKLNYLPKGPISQYRGLGLK